MTPLNESLAAQLKLVMETSGYSQAEMARKLGVQRQTLNQFLSGKKALVTTTLEKVLLECNAELVIKRK